MKRSMKFGAAVAMVCAVQGARATVIPTSQQLYSWGTATYASTVASLQVPGTPLFAETANTSGARYGGDSGYAYVWPAATQFRVYTDLAQADPVTYAPIMRSYADGLYASYWTATGGYRSGVSAGATRFYDDNAHVAVALAQAYKLTADPVYLTRATQTYAYCLTGESTAGGGGIYFSEPDHSTKDTISTLQAVRAALLLHRITNQASYLTDAQRLYLWAKTHTQQSNGLFMEKYYLTGAKAGTAGDYTLINSAGIGISDNLLFYDETGTASYLTEAQRIATASIPRYFDSSTGAINDEGYWDFELVDALGDLYQHDHNVAWLNDASIALGWLHANGRDSKGHYATLWGRGGNISGSTLSAWNLNDQASVAESYLHTSIAAAPEPASATLALLATAGLLASRRCKPR